MTSGMRALEKPSSCLALGTHRTLGSPHPTDGPVEEESPAEPSTRLWRPGYQTAAAGPAQDASPRGFLARGFGDQPATMLSPNSWLVELTSRISWNITAVKPRSIGTVSDNRALGTLQLRQCPAVPVFARGHVKTMERAGFGNLRGGLLIGCSSPAPWGSHSQSSSKSG